MQAKLKFINYNKNSSSCKGLETKYNNSGRNSTGKIVIRFKSKNNIKKYFTHDFFDKCKSMDFLIFNRTIHNYKSFFSSYIIKKDIIYPLGILVKIFSYQMLKRKINNFIYFFKRLFFSREQYFKIILYYILTSIKSKLEYFHNVCLSKLHVSETIKKRYANSKKTKI